MFGVSASIPRAPSDPEDADVPYHLSWKDREDIVEADMARCKAKEIATNLVGGPDAILRCSRRRGHRGKHLQMKRDLAKYGMFRREQ